jgi:hypothetical protein
MRVFSSTHLIEHFVKYVPTLDIFLEHESRGPVQHIWLQPCNASCALIYRVNAKP